ncbi:MULTISPECIES: undecaprenyldiphospho-muramoylpentapeptide beta-N-acetylglucosaminyltransferase [Virgibacillus]|uniref:undecaprenyldiphospho-muramoylpentapeptide beta-N-acetylglucosaminyltransferase n=1 Tax=Virgibacillus TaxID=84406 RepID=UPI00038822DB|nr:MULTISPECIES: undecaprenyldiphospho-muramoylpentapeptide beta-N-acetylglucosaminyltransferase [Virgibacillus]EQB35068.1 UDP-diphospho-muramoylpentapeptide beta-N- acetylglucosaminyltransferase [Virgibacillus sp. CM-4]MYL42874.1 undecaprenyldiphospho-muramoylpentapeptide beta-N-acetylglucosaminyltransferase [Virgibacillus massiliensis]
MNKKRILFTGGGTAGHVIVNLALIPYYQEQGWEIDYIGSKEGIERNLVSELDEVTYHPISTGKLRRYISKENIKDPFKVLKGTLQAINILRKRKPSVIFSKGGFVSVPVMLAAKLTGVPAVVHESDYTPGLANKIAMPFAQKVLATFPETLSYLPEKKSEYVGAVIRDELFQGSRQNGLDITGLSGEKPVLLIMGGSGGSEKINETVRNCLPQLLPFLQIIHICGHSKMDTAINEPGYRQFEYINEELKDMFAASDFVLSRAGSNAIFEFLALQLPMLLIPLSRQASRGDQIINAKSFAERRYARVLEEEALTDEALIEEIKQLTKSAPVMVDAMKQYKTEKAKDRVIEIISEVRK